jgi:uncharacterized protein YjiS (DUF1127 family)
MNRALSRIFALNRSVIRDRRRARFAADLTHLSDRTLRDIGFEPDSIRGPRLEAFPVRLPI